MKNTRLLNINCCFSCNHFHNSLNKNKTVTMLCLNKYPFKNLTQKNMLHSIPKWCKLPKMNTSKNSKLLNNFTKFCIKHPYLRFWQALFIWTGYTIYAKKPFQESEDTFYWTRKNKF